MFLCPEPFVDDDVDAFRGKLERDVPRQLPHPTVVILVPVDARIVPHHTDEPLVLGDPHRAGAFLQFLRKRRFACTHKSTEDVDGGLWFHWEQLLSVISGRRGTSASV